jgi:gluconolactonase
VSELREVASGLRYPDGPLVVGDGTLLVCEMAAGVLTKVTADGAMSLAAECGGSPSGAAVGPDGHVYVCNGGGWRWTRAGDAFIPGDRLGTQADDHTGGRIQRVDVGTGEVEDLYTECDGRPLRSPHDLVFDSSDGFWFTDLGHARARERDRTGVLWARADGSEIRQAVFPLDAPGGIALSPDGARLYVAETFTARLWYWDVAGPGEVVTQASPAGHGGRLVVGAPGYQLFASLAVDAGGHIAVATAVNGGITVVSPGGDSVEHAALPDPDVTNLCFGGDDLRTAYVTLARAGKLVAFEWPRPGLPLAFPPQ